MRILPGAADALVERQGVDSVLGLARHHRLRAQIGEARQQATAQAARTGQPARVWLFQDRLSTLSFAVQLRGFLGRMLSGSEKASWVAFFIDNDNNLLFELQDRSLTAYQVVGGRRLETGRLALLKGGNKVQVRLTADRVLHRVGPSGPLALSQAFANPYGVLTRTAVLGTQIP